MKYALNLEILSYNENTSHWDNIANFAFDSDSIWTDVFNNVDEIKDKYKCWAHTAQDDDIPTMLEKIAKTYCTHDDHDNYYEDGLWGTVEVSLLSLTDEEFDEFGHGGDHFYNADNWDVIESRCAYGKEQKSQDE